MPINTTHHFSFLQSLSRGNPTENTPSCTGLKKKKKSFFPPKHFPTNTIYWFYSCNSRSIWIINIAQNVKLFGISGARHSYLHPTRPQASKQTFWGSAQLPAWIPTDPAGDPKNLEASTAQNCHSQDQDQRTNTQVLKNVLCIEMDSWVRLSTSTNIS